MHILLPSDVFPPGSVGGAAWSAHTLARALIDHGHGVTAVVPQQTRGQPDQSGEPDQVDGVPAVRWHYHAPAIPFVQNYYRHERLWLPLAALLVSLGRAAAHEQLLIHAQHVQTTPAAVLAGRRLGVPVIATVRDHWPWDYFATGLHGNRCPYQMGATRSSQWASTATDLLARLGALRGVLALPAIPYILAHLRRRSSSLAQADAVIAVSSYIAGRLAPVVPAERLHILPNMVDIPAVERIAATPPDTVLDGPFLLYVGKLEQNKGAGLLAQIFRAYAAIAPENEPLPDPFPTLLIAGSGPLRAPLQRDLAMLGVPVRFLSWVPHDEILRLFARCHLLLFPSAWGEPLSRVLLEASALGAPILAMPTGGTPDIISDGVNGALARTPEQFARALARLLRNSAERRRLGASARRIAQERFSVPVVLPRLEALYGQAARELSTTCSMV
jgi:glycosyltransferase involved in cell wall biosynthesis